MTTATNLVTALVLVVLGITLAAAGIYLGETDDAPGAALAGILLLFGSMALALRKLLRRT